MCGVFGVTDFRVDQLPKARECLSQLHHRGPDQWSDFFDDQLYVGHRRLSINDLSEYGKQPIVSAKKDVVVAVNGEIYNYKKLKAELETNFEFKSTSDSEVVLHGYVAWGIEGLLDRLDGMYSIFLYDVENSRVFLARDRYGVKPLYFSEFENRFCWSSELKALEIFHGDSLVIDYTAVYDFLTYSYIPTPKSLYKGIFKLEPAHFLEIDLRLKSSKKVKYWSLPTNKCDDDFEIAADKIRDLVEDSVGEQMLSDVPVGCFSSGGIDSSIIVSLASQAQSALDTFSLGFQEKSHDETEYARFVCELYQTNFRHIRLDENDVRGAMEFIKNWYDEPFADTSCIPSFFVSKLASKTNKVVLGGDGADEVFGGYIRYRRFWQLRRFAVPLLRPLKSLTGIIKSWDNYIGTFARRFETLCLLDDLECYVKLLGGMLKCEKDGFRKAWGIDIDYDDYWYFRKYYRRDLDFYTRLQYLDFHTYLHDDIFTKIDRVSMAVSLECRVPFMKKELVEYSFSLHDKVRCPGGALKGLLKAAFKDLLPEQVINRPKKGFSIPDVDASSAVRDQRRVVLKILDLWKLSPEGI